MPDLIVDVSQTALATGISNELFQPGPESAKEFYAEKPINLRMVGTYHQFGAFVSGVASLPRVVIMTMHNISLTPRVGKPGLLVLEGTIKTYRYLDDEIAAQPSGPTGGEQVMRMLPLAAAAFRLPCCCRRRRALGLHQRHRQVEAVGRRGGRVPRRHSTRCR
jgi:hypothetical protein